MVAVKAVTVTVVQQTSADLRLNPHYYAIVLDGVFAPGELDDLPRLAEPHERRVADPLKVCRVRVLRCLERRGVIEAGAELLVLDGDLTAKRALRRAQGATSQGAICGVQAPVSAVQFAQVHA